MGALCRSDLCRASPASSSAGRSRSTGPSHRLDRRPMPAESVGTRKPRGRLAGDECHLDRQRLVGHGSSLVRRAGDSNAGDRCRDRRRPRLLVARHSTPPGRHGGSCRGRSPSDHRASCSSPVRPAMPIRCHHAMDRRGGPIRRLPWPLAILGPPTRPDPDAPARRSDSRRSDRTDGMHSPRSSGASGIVRTHLHSDAIGTN